MVWALHSEESKLKPAAAVLKNVEQQSQAKQEHGAQKRQLDTASERTAKRRSEKEECRNDEEAE